MDLMHRKNILHRDLKPENILILNKQELLVSIADLGLACNSDDPIQTKVKCGTPGFVDPDILAGTPFSGKSDVFSLGCVFYNLITHKMLYTAENPKKLLHKNQYSDPTKTIEKTCQKVSE